MRMNRIVLSTALVVVALVVQVSVLARLHLPGAVPDLLLLVVLGLALTYGHVGGCLIGFGAGLLADLAPPADHAVGRYALVLCVIGYLAGLARPDSGPLRSAAMPMVVVAAAAIASTLLYAGVGALVGDTAARHVGIAKLMFTATVYDLLLAPFVVPLDHGAGPPAANTTRWPATPSAAAAAAPRPTAGSSSGTEPAAAACGGSRRRSAQRGGQGRSAVSNIPETGRTQRVTIRLVILQILVLSLLLTLGGRLWYLQIRNGQQYTAEAANNHIQQVVAPAVRGSILDARGVPLADNETKLVVSVSRTDLLQQAGRRQGRPDPAGRACWA